MFNLSDRTYDRMPNYMSIETAITSIEKFYSYASKYGLPSFNIVLHGGEPTLWPYDNFKRLLEYIERLRATKIDIQVTLQTNMLVFDVALFQLFKMYRVSIGISLDGPFQINDKYRVDHGGRGSYERVINNVHDALDQDYASILGGFLSVAQPEVPPDEFLQWCDDLPLRRVNVLWPIQFHHQNPPWKLIGLSAYKANPIYGIWFSEVFKIWWQKDDPTLYIRLFFNLIELLLGSKAHIDSLVNDTLDMFVINTDGSIEYSDYFRSFTDGGAKTEFNIIVDDIQSLENDVLFSFCLKLASHIPTECKGCLHEHICGGGFLPGRMTIEQLLPTGKSVLCYDQFHFFSSCINIMSNSNKYPLWLPTPS